MKQIPMAFAVIAIALASPSAGLAVDCEALIKNINKERNFLKRKEMVESAAKQCPDNPILVFKYGFSLERFNNFEQALVHYKKAAELEPNMAKAYFGMGDVLRQLERYQEAIDAYNKGLEIEPTNVRAIKSRMKAEEKLKAGN